MTSTSATNGTIERKHLCYWKYIGVDEATERECGQRFLGGQYKLFDILKPQPFMIGARGDGDTKGFYAGKTVVRYWGVAPQRRHRFKVRIGAVGDRDIEFVDAFVFERKE